MVAGHSDREITASHGLQGVKQFLRRIRFSVAVGLGFGATPRCSGGAEITHEFPPEAERHDQITSSVGPIFAASDRASDFEAREIHQFLQMFRFPELAEMEQFRPGTLVPLMPNNISYGREQSVDRDGVPIGPLSMLFRARRAREPVPWALLFPEASLGGRAGAENASSNATSTVALDRVFSVALECRRLRVARRICG
jgi:hypothetical protein